MTKPSNENKLTARTAPAIVEEVKLLVVRLSRSDLKYRGRKMNIEGMVGAVLLDFLRQSPGDQEAILRRRIPEVEAMFESGEAQSETPAERGAGFITTVDLPVPEGRTVARPPSPRKRKNGGA